MICKDAEPLLSAYVDRELDLVHSLEVEKHIAECDSCTEAYRKLEWLRVEIASVNLDWSEEADLRRLRAQLKGGSSKRTGPYIAALAAVAAVLMMAVFLPGRFRGVDDSLDRQMIDNHVRSLMAEHLVDVPSSDRHTVKPWFQGKLDFAPDVPDLSAAGFVLIGGRLDVTGGHQAAAIVYKRQSHVINLWISNGAAENRAPDSRTVNGFHLLRWQAKGASYCAVSDLNAAELRVFADLIRSQ